AAHAGHGHPAAVPDTGGRRRVVPIAAPRDSGRSGPARGSRAIGGRRGGGGHWVYRFDPASNGQRQPVDAWRLVDRITAPTLVVRGELSQNFTREMADKLRAAIPAAAYVEIPGAYHHLVLDNPKAFVQAVDPFLTTTLRGGGG